jgi:hypothetical protein
MAGRNDRRVEDEAKNGGHEDGRESPLQLAQKCPRCGGWLLKGQLIVQLQGYDYHFECAEEVKAKPGKKRAP